MLRYYLTVVREENMSRAAEALHLTQPTLSRQIASLEKELGTSLFRRGRRLELTDAGRRLARRAEELLALADKVETEFRDGTELTGTVSIGSGDLSSTRILPAAMGTFRRRHPGVGFELYTNSAEYVKERLDAGLLDFAIMLEPVDVSHYAYIRLGVRERWGLLTRSDDELARRDSIVPQDLVGRPLVSSGRPELAGEIISWLGMPVERLDITCTVNLLPTALTLVESGTASALTIDGAVTHLDPRRFAFRPLSPALTMSSVFAWKKGGPGGAVPTAFLDLLRVMQSGHGGL
ncbi:Transcription regulator HTH, LysR [Propionibacterium ruminifibrarum]|uniref:Transcription regulator HTH, LysR n=1 Tax=Propionibacterium ruminifibrarum TaxID=1962131 RepID=A0A375I6N6_9ACTN|nr:Transcription regulator HTH, LysR [Propionibacterium ruminifibrarum]